MLDYLRTLYRYNAWANIEVVKSLRRSSQLDAADLRMLGHMIGAEYLWYSRLCGEQSPVAVWPEMELDACEKELQELEQIWQSYFSRISEGELARTVEYVNSLGEPWTSSVRDIAMHVVMHSGYHRGQIATSLRGAGVEPAYTDFIHCMRQGLIQGE